MRYFLVVWGSKRSFPAADNETTTTNSIDKKINKKWVTLTYVGQKVTHKKKLFKIQNLRVAFKIEYRNVSFHREIPL